MNSKVLMDLTEAYVAVYDDDLRSEIEYNSLSEEDFSFMEDLSDNELTYIMEEILLEGRFTLDECLDVFEGEYLFEASAARERRAAQAGQKRKEAIQKATRPARAMGRLAMGRLKKAATQAGENIKSGVKSAQKYASDKVSSAKSKIRGFIGKVAGAAHRTAVDVAAAPGIAKRAAGTVATRLTHKAANAGAKVASDVSKKLMNVAHSSYEKGGGESLRKKLASPPSSPAPRGSTYRHMGVGRRETVSSGGVSSRPSGPIGSMGSQGRALPPVGKTKTGKTLTQSQRNTQIQAKNRRLGFAEDIEFFNYIIDDLIQEGYAYDINEAIDIIESLSDYEFDNLVESYLDTDVETYDFYDTVMDYLLDEGFADSEEDAEVIMANMSDEWRDDIIETAVNTYTGKPIHADPNDPEEVAKRERRKKRGRLTFQDNSDPRRTGGRRPSRWN